jgi:hypothetical protein
MTDASNTLSRSTIDSIIVGILGFQRQNEDRAQMLRTFPRDSAVLHEETAKLAAAI